MINPLQFDVLLAEQDAKRLYDRSYSDAEHRAGSKELMFYSQNGAIKIISSIYVKAGSAYVLALEEFLRVGSSDITFKQPGFEGEFFRLLNDANGYELRAYTDQALFCTAPGRNAVIDGVLVQDVQLRTVHRDNLHAARHIVGIVRRGPGTCQRVLIRKVHPNLLEADHGGRIANVGCRNLGRGGWQGALNYQIRRTPQERRGGRIDDRRRGVISDDVVAVIHCCEGHQRSSDRKQPGHILAQRHSTACIRGAGQREPVLHLWVRHRDPAGSVALEHQR